MPRFGRCKMSFRSQVQFGNIKHKTGLNINVIARYALCLSLRDPSIPNPDEYDEKGMEIGSSVLFGEYDRVFMAIMLKRLEKDQLDPYEHLNKMVRSHVNRGATMLRARINGLTDFYDVIRNETGY